MAEGLEGLGRPRADRPVPDQCQPGRVPGRRREEEEHRDEDADERRGRAEETPSEEPSHVAGCYAARARFPTRQIGRAARAGCHPAAPGQKSHRPTGEVFTFSTRLLMPHATETVWRNEKGWSSAMSLCSSA